MKLTVLIAVLVFCVAALAADTGAELFQKAVTQERAAGNLEEAIKLYQRVAKEFASDRPLAAKALVQAARCYEKLGQDKAVKIYEQVARDFSDQREFAATASARLAALRQPAARTMTQRRIELSGAVIDWSPYSDGQRIDGQRAIFFDEKAGGLVLSDLAGRDRRVIFKAKRGSLFPWSASRDFSMVLLRFAPEANGLSRLAVINADGTGYREIARLKDPYGAFNCAPSWSWDSRFVLACDIQADGTRRYLSISVDNGQVRELFRDQPTIRPRPAFSPDGRFFAFGDGRRGVFVLPVQGGSPRLAVTNGSFLDWTRDGQHLLIVSRRSGAEGLYLVPVKEGQAAGDPVLVRYGSFVNGHTTASGALVYQTVPPGGYWRDSVANFDPDGRVSEWKELNLRVGGAAGPGASWSPDGAQIVYTATRDDSGQPGSVMIVRNMTTGEEREVYRDSNQVWCAWAPQPNLVCERIVASGGGATEIFSVAVNSGRAEALATLPEGLSGFRPNSDGRTFTLFFSSPEMGWYTWEIGAQRAAKVEDQVPPTLWPSEKWFPRIVNGRELEIRPMSGGGRKHLVTLNGEFGLQVFPIEYTPDGKWILYGDKDSTGKDSLFRVSPGGGKPERLGDLPSGYLRGCTLTLSPDGHRILAEANRAVSPEFWLLENFVPKSQPAR